MKPKWQRNIAEERIQILFEEAEKAFPGRKDRANRYVELARRIAMKYRIKIPQELKRRFCDECHSYLQPGANCDVEIDSKKKTAKWTCKECGHVKRYPYRG